MPTKNSSFVLYEIIDAGLRSLEVIELIITSLVYSSGVALKFSDFNISFNFFDMNSIFLSFFINLILRELESRLTDELYNAPTFSNESIIFSPLIFC